MPWHVGVGEHDAAVENDDAPLHLDAGAVPSYLPEAAQENDPDRLRLRCVAALAAPAALRQAKRPLRLVARRRPGSSAPGCRARASTPPSAGDTDPPAAPAPAAWPSPAAGSGTRAWTRSRRSRGAPRYRRWPWLSVACGEGVDDARELGADPVRGTTPMTPTALTAISGSVITSSPLYTSKPAGTCGSQMRRSRRAGRPPRSLSANDGRHVPARPEHGRLADAPAAADGNVVEHDGEIPRRFGHGPEVLVDACL